MSGNTGFLPDPKNSLLSPEIEL